jgi:hypothetical protein
VIFCVRCETNKPDSEYYTSIARSWCKSCRITYSKARYALLSPANKKDLIRVTKLKRKFRQEKP